VGMADLGVAADEVAVSGAVAGPAQEVLVGRRPGDDEVVGQHPNRCRRCG
jgi:hypothetical protein